MRKEFLKKIKEKLEKERASVEKLLKEFAKKDKELKGDWDTVYPSFNGASGGGALEIEADELQEYESKLDVEYLLELKLKDINSALQKIKKGQYGICERCGKKISQKRLEVFPGARFCLKCEKKSLPA